MLAQTGPSGSSEAAIADRGISGAGLGRNLGKFQRSGNDGCNFRVAGGAAA
jgi:hypothetical protein